MLSREAGPILVEMKIWKKHLVNSIEIQCPRFDAMKLVAETLQVLNGS
jgi:hypothetical protein